MDVHGGPPRPVPAQPPRRRQVFSAPHAQPCGAAPREQDDATAAEEQQQRAQSARRADSHPRRKGRRHGAGSKGEERRSRRPVAVRRRAPLAARPCIVAGERAWPSPPCGGACAQGPASTTHAFIPLQSECGISHTQPERRAAVHHIVRDLVWLHSMNEVTQGWLGLVGVVHHEYYTLPLVQDHREDEGAS
eukprot:scaffold734_cov352-Prasinococcus_capsulatus_cf.AAC.5